MNRRDTRQEWMLLIHQLPPKPTSLRVRTWRKLQRLGAVPVKNSVYVLPYNEKTHEDFQWLKQEIEAARGEATVFRAGSVEGATDDEIVATFRKLRDEDYEQITAELDGLAGTVRGQKKGGHLSPGRVGAHETELSRLHQELERVVAVDFFQAPKRAAAASALERCREALRLSQSPDGRGAKGPTTGGNGLDTALYQGRRWVTRRRPHIDRLATAWLVRRFIDKRPRFLFVEEGERVEGGVHYDMADAEFTHRGEDCTFETVVKEFGLAGDPALREIAEIVHDIDLKDGKFNRLEAAGINLAVRGIASVITDDRKLVRQAAVVFDGLYEYLTRKGAKGERDGGSRKGGGGKRRTGKAGRK
ncbi:MAG: chromate resistance protein [Acidobacteria bacterium]|nr:chromate resistance protein [Acidobacteriota bacterium]